jgi:hypothetical protein
MDFSVSRWFLVSLWWRELLLLGSCFGLVSLGTTWLLVKRLSASSHQHKVPRFSSSTAAHERRIEGTIARNVLKRRSINENYHKVRGA